MRRKLALLALLALPVLAAAQTAASAPAGTEVPPPPTVSSNQTAGPEPEVRIIQKGQDKIEEYRLNGKLYMVKVTPSIGIPYYLMDEDGSGNLRQIDPNRRIIIPRWVLIRF